MLSLKKIESPRKIEMADVNFINITYRELWGEVRIRLGSRAASAATKWLVCLLDFMNTTEFLSEGSMELSNEDQFCIAHYAAVQSLVIAHSEFTAKLNRQIVEIKIALDSSDDTRAQKADRWIYKDPKDPFHILVHDFVLSGHKIALDLKISTSAAPWLWTLWIFDRNDSGNAYIRDPLFAKNGISHLGVDEDLKFKVVEWPLVENMETIKQELLKWIRLIAPESTGDSLTPGVSQPYEPASRLPIETPHN